MCISLKTKIDDSEKVEKHQYLNVPVPSSNEDEVSKVASWASTHLRGRADPNLNAVKIEKLSDDEEVDITDEMDEILSPEPQPEPGKSELVNIPKISTEHNWTEPILDPARQMSTVLLTEGYIPDQSTVESSETAMLCSDKHGNGPVKSENQICDRKRISDGTDWFSSPELCGDHTDLAGSSILFHPSDQLEEDNQIDAEELKPPDQELEIDRNTILEEEKQAIPEFFVGRQAKTPERYLKIRNYILDQW